MYVGNICYQSPRTPIIMKKPISLIVTGFLFLLLLVHCDSDSVINTSDNRDDKGDPPVTDTTRSDSTDTGNEPGSSADAEWLIPRSDIVDGGPGKDGIPSIDDPNFTLATNIGHLDPSDLVIGIKIGDEVRAYPHKILDYHEIVNDQLLNTPVCVTYCPLTGTAIAWNRVINGEVTEFGVSGLLYKNNLIPYDRQTDSEWSQMLNLSVHGENKGFNVETFNIVEAKWSTWLNSYPSSKVLSLQTGYSRDYNRYPYGDYKTDDDFLLFPVGNKDDRLPNKERVHGIEIDSSYVAYPIKEFGSELTVSNTEIEGKKIVIFGSNRDNIVESYYRTIDGNTLTFSAVRGEYPVVLKDESGSEWNIFGEAVSGPKKGQQLRSTQSYNGYWFAFADFFPGLPILRPQPVTSIPEY